MRTTLLSVSLALLLASPAARGDDAKPAKDAPLDLSFLRLYSETRGFMLGRPVKAKPTPDGKAVLFLRAEAKVPKLMLYEYDVGAKEAKLLLTPEKLLKGAEENLSPEEKARRERMRVSVGGFTDYQLDESGKLILLSLSGRLYVFERDGGKVKELATGKGTLLDPKFSPDGKQVAYVLDHDVHVYDLATGKETRVTKGGTEKKPHGLAEFVAQEEMGRFSGYWWSPDGKHLAYQETDHDGVEVWYVADPAKPEQEPSNQFYPRPGKKNAAVRLGIVPTKGGDTVWVEWDSKKYEYLASVRWDRHGPLTIAVQNRLQNELVLLKVDPKTGKTKELLKETTKGFLNLDQDVPRWLESGDFLWSSEAAEGPQLERRGPDGKLKRVVVRGSFRYEGLVAVLEKKKEVVCQLHFDPTSLLVARFGLDEETAFEPHWLSKGTTGVDGASFNRDGSLYVLNSTRRDSMPRSRVYDAAHKEVGELPSVAEAPPRTPSLSIERVGPGDGYFAAVVRPGNFDPKKKYPVLLYVYGGPKHLQVEHAMRGWLLPQWFADQGFIVVALDNRGTPGRGREWEQAIYKKFGTVPLEDQVAGLKALGKKYPEMDLDRVGVYGWSFGGYLSALAVLKQPDVFKAAIAGAPVADWEDYDTHYTERYLGLPKDNPEAYKDASLLTHAAKLERPLLLVHGTADDNVYFRHSLRLANALFREGKDFEMLPLSGLTHMVPDPVVMQRMYGRFARYFQKHLGKPVDAGK
jgi:dipeptidyl-peptidase-4